jgi:hypothetical protein
MGDHDLHKTSSYLDVQRKLVKEKLAKRIQNDRDDYKYAQKNRAALAGGTGVLVLLSVFAFGILELGMWSTKALLSLASSSLFQEVTRGLISSKLIYRESVHMVDVARRLAFCGG